MPNPEKVESKQKLHSKVAEAALARMKGAGAQGGSGATATPQGAMGQGIGRVGGSGNVFGFGGVGAETAKEKPPPTGTNSGAGGSRKKVVKKPPPNFGGGVLGKK